MSSVSPASWAFAVLLFWVCEGKGTDLNGTNVTANVTAEVTFDLNTGENGLFNLNYAVTDGENSGSATVSVKTQGMTEIDANGNLVPGAPGGVIPTFSTQTFTPSAPEAVTVGSGVQATKTSTRTVVPGVGTLDLDFLALQSEGSVGPTNEWSAKPGDSKVNVGLSSWTFSAAAAFIDLDMDFSEGDNVITETELDTYDLGQSVLILTSTVTVDGTDVTMPSGFPKLANKNGAQVFVFRFPRFTNSLAYDPLIQPKREQIIDGTATSDDTTTGSDDTTTGGDNTASTGDDGDEELSAIFDEGSYRCCTASALILAVLLFVH